MDSSSWWPVVTYCFIWSILGVGHHECGIAINLTVFPTTVTPTLAGPSCVCTHEAKLIKFGYLCIQEVLIVTKSSVRPTLGHKIFLWSY